MSAGLRATAALINSAAWEQVNCGIETPAAPTVGRVYLSGPMSDIPLYNHPAFNAEAARLRNLGWHVENPAEAPLPPSSTWNAFMRHAIPSLLSCQHIRMLDGWTMSRGARLEHHIAIAMDIDVLHDAECAGPGDGPLVAAAADAAPAPSLTIGAIGAQAVSVPVAVSEGGVLRWMTGRKIQECELYTSQPARAILAASAPPGYTPPDWCPECHARESTPDSASPAAQEDAKTETPKQCWSANEEEFNHDSLGDLIDANADDLKVGDTVWFADAVTPDTDRLYDTDDMFVQMNERAYDIAGEHTEDYPDVDQAATDELKSLLDGWIKKHAPPNFYEVKNVKPYVLTADDLA